MAKQYTDELAAWVEKRGAKKRRQDAAVVAFMAVKADVFDSMNKGYALTTIWEHMHATGKLKCSYETFRKHVRRFIKAPAATTEPDKPAKGLAGQEATDTKGEKPAAPGVKKSGAPSIAGFTFDATPKKEDLF